MNGKSISDSGLIHQTFTPREVTWYYITESEISEIKSNSSFESLFLGVASICWSGFLSILLSLINGVDLMKGYLWIFLILSIFFTVMSIYFIFFKTMKVIRTVKGHASVELEQVYSTKSFKILTATYGTQQKSIDVTDILQKMVNDNKLDFHGSYNEIFTDPVKNILKHLTIRYQVGNTNYPIKTYKENDPISLP